MEKVQLSKCFAAMNTGIPSKLVGVNNGVSVLATPGEVSELSGCGVLPTAVLSEGKWYRIAIGNYCSASSSTIINICKSYTYSAPSSQLLYINADGYSESQNVMNIFSSRKAVSKVRILYKKVENTRCIVDIYINTTNQNPFSLSYACNIGFKFQMPVEVSNTPDDGYSVKEFVL